ncbi:reducing type I polyketide synthase [Durotheca rogersii]|uniref:reducing type I polyketide synthase n=1 Tax=Durotheca rogersii TaxID=419775 RepID=UPI00221FC4CE|nr:reducing type I polyketide synthase [Durotheca rogersii]KAI5862010.1 reducing type I polyketide synthase [Durotheca rogersii]
MACRLPGHCHTPKALWDFMKAGGIAKNDVPKSRFSLDGHYDGSKKPYTMKTPGGMFLEDVDPADFDAQFFNINHMDASSMDPQQRNLMEVAYECLENAGVPIESLSGKRVGCLVGASAVDYHDMTCRDPEDRTESPTMGSGRALLSNRISHFLNVHGPSITLDTACSSTLIALDTACLYLHANQCDAMLVGGVNMYLSPERNQDMGAMRPTASSTGRCHTFDAKADGYTEAEAINAVYLKRLDDAIRDGDPIRAVIRGTATNSAGKTPGIANPNPKAQAMAIRAAYANAGISEQELAETGYLECHGTGTLVGDPAEVEGAASVFAETRRPDRPLVIGSVKSNIGHSEAAAGLSGLIKAVLAIENRSIPGTATFITPNPKIDFEKSRVKASRNSLPWPAHTKFRASVNSFGFGGANAHAVIESPEYLLKGRALRYKLSFVDELSFDDFDDSDDDLQSSAASSSKPKLIVMSANDEISLKASIKSLSSHLINPGVSVNLQDLAYTLSERRSQLYHRSYSIHTNTQISGDSFEFGKRAGQDSKIGFIFTGQGAQWPTMGKQLLEAFPIAKAVVDELDKVLQSLPEPPKWSLFKELTEDRDAAHLREPEFSQPLVTALQLAMLAVLYDWGIKPTSVVGHSSGEIAAAVAAGYLLPEEAIKIAYFRGQAGKEIPPAQPVGMLAVGIGADKIEAYIDADDDHVQIACHNSPRSLTISGTVAALERLRDRLQADSHFARMLQVNYAYHSKYMSAIGKKYFQMLQAHCKEPLEGSKDVTMFSSVLGRPMDKPADALYWLENMVSEVRFDQAATEMLKGKDSVNFLVELGPAGALKGPVSQIIDALPSTGGRPVYTSAAKRGPDALLAMYETAGKLFVAGGSVNIARVNEYSVTEPPSTLVDLPNYVWNHTKKYWHESPASNEWRYRPFVKHDLLGTKILGTSWKAPIWRNTLRLGDNQWLRDHKIGEQVVFPGAGYVAMAIEAIYQATCMTTWADGVPEKYQFRLRDVKFFRALVLDDSYDPKVMLSLQPAAASVGPWHQFKVSSILNEAWSDHASGLIRIETEFTEVTAPEGALTPLRSPVNARSWYKAMLAAGFNFGPSFQKHLTMEYTAGQRKGRSTVSLEAPPSAWQQSPYVMHPACMDGCFQTVLSSAWQGDRSAVDAALVPLQIDSLVIPWRAQQPSEGIAVARSEYGGIGRTDVAKNWSASTTTYHPVDGSLLLEMKGLRYTELDNSTKEATLSHTYSQLRWQPDASLLSEAGFRELVAGVEEKTEVAVAQKLLDIFAHKSPSLSVLEVDLTSSESASSIWLEANSPIRAACTRYQFASSNVNGVLSLQETYSNAEFTVLDFSNDETVTEEKFDIALVNLPAHPEESTEVAVSNIKKSLTDRALVVVLGKRNILEQVVRKSAFSRVWYSDFAALAQAASAEATPAGAQDVYRFKFSDINSETLPAIDASLNETAKWNVVPVSKLSDISPRSKILITDELEAPVMSQLNGQQWDTLKYLVKNECDILWVTAGAQMQVTNPTKAAINGFFRVLRNEEPLLRLINLDVEDPSGNATVDAIDACLDLLYAKETSKTQIDSEFVERRGVIHISRILPDEAVNVAKEEQVSGRPAETIELHSAKNCIRLKAERIGNIDSLHYGEVSDKPLPVPENCVEIEVYASGVNFKEVAVTVGIVPENEHLLGGEGAGIVTRVAPDVTDFEPGQRVVFFEKGSFANRAITTTQRVRRIPDSMTFEEASTIPCVFMTSMYALYRLARLKKGDRVLIHSAAGGVGISAIQLALHVGAEVYATVGTQEKRDFLKSRFGIPDERIFSSRSKAFGEQILSYTGGKGVDVILNSLTGDLLDESWRIIADGGTMVEIGKKDILDRNSLAMEPFNRNASFRALDLSHKEISDDTIKSLLTDIFNLMEEGRLKPIAPMKVFSFTDIPAAFRLLRSGKHTGKLVISDGPDAKIEVPVRKAPRGLKLRDDVSYLIVGGLRGLCSSLATFLAQNGAKHIAVISRSGHDDARSQKVVEDIRALGSNIDLLRGDVSNLEDVRAAFKATSVPIGGIVQGAMVLRDRVFESMSIEEYHAALGCKVDGTWNLHQVSMEQGLDLDFFTLLSSISGLCGSKGQANYAAGNAFLDAFAAYRQSLGLAACSVDLGVIQDVGYMAEHDELQDRYDAAVWHAINERLLRKIFGFTLMQQQPEAINAASSSHMVTGIQVPQPEDSFLLRDARFAGLRLKEEGGSKKLDGSKDVQAILVMQRSKADPAAVLQVTVDVLNRYLTTSLRLSEALDAARPLSTYGIDSLAAVEFRNWLRIDLAVEVTTLEIVNAPSLISISEKVIARIPTA